MKVVLQNVILRFADVFKAEEFKAGDGRPRFTASFLVEPGSENDKNINEAIKAAAKEAWADKADKMLKTMSGQKTQYCYRDGDTLTYDGCEGMMFLAAARAAKQGAPKIVDRAKQDITQESGKLYPGCTVNAIVDVWAQSGDNPGIRCTLSTVQFVKDGEAFSGSVPSTDELPDLSEDLEDDDLV